ncbi:MAG: histidine--tRNA ligase [Gammaproteobacteria bacterium]|nr:histidine--tRNA ligase [Gammaproteobacteria bacterium]
MSDRSPLVRGMRDLYAEELASIRIVESVFRDTLESYGYELIRLPTMERTALFSRGIGESTDAVSKEMFTLDDETESLSLRPEGTASCVRAVIDANLYRGNQPKLWYVGSMFRHERPQLGRYREFFQVGAEAFGFNGPDVDTELIRIVQDVWERLDVTNEITLEINSLGNTASRLRHRDALVDYFEGCRDDLDEDSQRRLEINPLRILDSKNERTQEIVERAPNMSDYLDDESRRHFDEFQERLARLGIHATVNHRLVRGLDYYTHGVFEWNTARLGAQKQVGGGGRYDGLCELLGGAPCPAAGFAIGVDRVALLRKEIGLKTPASTPDVYVLALSDEEEEYALQVASQLRETSSFGVRVHQGGGKAKARMRAADRSGASIALIIGAQEAADNQVSIKWLRINREQVTVPVTDLPTTLLTSN